MSSGRARRPGRGGGWDKAGSPTGGRVYSRKLSTKAILAAGRIAGRHGFPAAVGFGAVAGGIAGEHAVEGFDLAAGFVEVDVIVFPKLGEFADGFFVVLFEELRGAVCLMRAEAKRAEDIDAEVEGVAS